MFVCKLAAGDCGVPSVSFGKSDLMYRLVEGNLVCRREEGEAEEGMGGEEVGRRTGSRGSADAEEEEASGRVGYDAWRCVGLAACLGGSSEEALPGFTGIASFSLGELANLHSRRLEPTR